MEQIRFEKFNFTYPESDKKALEEIDLYIEAGEFVVVLGHSGCGKSTLLRQIKKDIAPFGKKEGRLYIEGKDIEELSMRERSTKIGFVMQDPDSQIVTDKVWHELAFGLESLGIDSKIIRVRVAEMASYFGIEQWFYKEVAELSGGQKQLLNLASIMAMHPSVLILDEPTSQLDPIAAADFLGTVKKINSDLGITIIMTEHRLEEVLPIADKVVVMENGKLFSVGTSKEVAINLYKENHHMFEAMPTATQIALMSKEVETSKNLPMTAGEGRRWLDNFFGHNFNSDYQTSNNDTQSGNEKKKKDSCAIWMNEVWYRYEKDSPDVVKGISLGVFPGEIYGLLGGNGTGKSTTLSLISRIRTPYRGKIFINGKNIKKYSEKELYCGLLGVVPQNPQSLFVKKTVELELFEMVGKKTSENSAWVKDIVKLMHLETLMDRHPYDISGGEQHRLAIAKILLLKPKILLLDEPTKGLDVTLKRELADILISLKEKEITVFMISHDIEFCAHYCDRCGLLFDGNIVAENSPKEFFSGNSFYTTSANKIAREYWKKAITAQEVVCNIESVRKSKDNK